MFSQSCHLLGSRVFIWTSIDSVMSNVTHAATFAEAVILICGYGRDMVSPR